MKLVLSSTKKLARKIGFLLGVYDGAQKLLSVAFFISYFNRDILLFNSSNKNIKNSSMTFLIDQYIQSNIKQNKLLDFEGSNIPGVKRFYKGFGSIERNYIDIMK